MTTCGFSNAMPMIAILAGGLATRLYPLTASLPKSMVPVAGEPFVAHQLRKLAAQGFYDVVICAGYLGEQIEAFVGDGGAFGCRVGYSFDGETPLGTGGALRGALPLLEKDFLVMYGDSYLNQPFQPVWTAFRRSGKAALMTVFRNEDKFDASNVEYADGEIVRYDKRARRPAMRHIDYGLGCLRADRFGEWAPADGAFDLADFYSAMAARGELAGFEVGERFYEIGSPAGLAETEAFIAQMRGAGE
jgi:NDP-sugar pyrophosphorylase family protein